jgi:ferredoxin
MLRNVPHEEAGVQEIEEAEHLLKAAAEKISRKMKTENLNALLQDNFDHPEWDKVAGRCLACANCTMVCPTCFCSSMEDVTDLDNGKASRWRVWDSCFTMDFAKVASGNFRPSVKARYRQWLMHKLGYWNDQFGTSGCVGCGRCITWCPVGIDITQEVETIRTTSIKKEPEHAY